MNRLLLLLTIILLSAISITKAQEPVTITNFKGLNTLDGDFVVQSNFARIANNVMFSRDGKNAISKRPGYAYIDSVTLSDSIVSLGVYQKNNGVKQLIVVADDKTSPDTGWGSVYLSPANSDAISTGTKIRGRWPIVNRTHFLTYRDWIIGMNGSANGMIWNSRKA